MVEKGQRIWPRVSVVVKVSILGMNGGKWEEREKREEWGVSGFK